MRPQRISLGRIWGLLVLLALEVILSPVFARRSHSSWLGFQHQPLSRRPGRVLPNRRPLPAPTTEVSNQLIRSNTALNAMQFDIIHIAGDVVAGFVGGTVGVLGTILALEYKMKKVDERSKCPYCTGAGTIQCAHCYGGGVLCYKHATGSVDEKDCPTCQGSGYITCINCKGDGLAIPVMLNKKLSRDPETRLEALGLG